MAHAERVGEKETVFALSSPLPTLQNGRRKDIGRKFPEEKRAKNAFCFLEPKELP